jgi:hypothetical protein
MSCSPCVNKHFLGCFDHCVDITGLVSDEVGTHELVYEFGASINTITIEVPAGGVITIPNTFNEVAYICFQIVKPSRANLTLTIGAVTYECFCFQNKL